MSQRAELKLSNEMLSEQIESEKTHYAALVDQYETARSLRHDTSVCGNPEIFFGGKLNGVGIPENEYKVTDSALVQNVVAAIEAR